MPGWLAQLLTRTAELRQAQPPLLWRRLAQGVEEGARNDATARLYGRYLGKGLDPIEARDLLIAWDAQWNRPPLGREEVVQTCESIARRELAKRNGRVIT